MQSANAIKCNANSIINMKNRLVILMIVVFIHTGCTTTSPLQSVVLPSQGDIELPLKTWQVDARFAFKSQEEKFSASLYWLQHNSDFDLRLSKLLGGTLLTLNKSDSFTVLEMDDKRYRDTDPARLLSRITGWTIPVEQMRDWVQGVPPVDSDLKTVNRNKNGRLTSFETNAGWKVTYRDYQKVRNVSLPKNIVIKKADLTLRLRISNWVV